MAGEAGRVRVVLERSGGLLGRPIRRGLDSADLPESEAVRLRELARGVVAPAPPAGGPDRQVGGAAPRGGPVEGERGVKGADRFVYTLEVDYTPAVDQQGERGRADLLRAGPGGTRPAAGPAAGRSPPTGPRPRRTALTRAAPR
ncbi:protealysin inhibitor emfourin [Candidatus Frankia alpina]|uniref:protealysin inhibitor emfourin n=1 Tax=Candidatus Frankia alpina TaxID=2699483 RepID=UPI001F393D8A|nr:protealysin inhibitor emfourin [Candidatus Frankia alpina]